MVRLSAAAAGSVSQRKMEKPKLGKVMRRATHVESTPLGVYRVQSWHNIDAKSFSYGSRAKG